MKFESNLNRNNVCSPVVAGCSVGWVCRLPGQFLRTSSMACFIQWRGSGLPASGLGGGPKKQSLAALSTMSTDTGRRMSLIYGMHISVELLHQIFCGTDLTLKLWGIETAVQTTKMLLSGSEIKTTSADWPHQQIVYISKFNIHIFIFNWQISCFYQ